MRAGVRLGSSHEIQMISGGNEKGKRKLVKKKKEKKSGVKERKVKFEGY